VGAERLRLFMEFAPAPALSEVPDPYYGDGDGFAQVFDMIEAASGGLLEEIRRTHL
jgi:protein-tyrosine phosphatase